MTNPYAPPAAMVQDLADPLVKNLPADRGTRLAASILDTLIFAAMVYLPIAVGFGVGAVTAAGDVEAPGFGLGVAVGAIAACIGLVVWLWLTIHYMQLNGQSIGKKITRIKVIRSDGSPVTLSRLIWLRNVVNWIISFIPLYGVVDVLFIFAESRQCLHDKLADTVVVKA